jgi:hypothetical protein
VLLQNPNGSPTDLTNWSDVIEFLPQAPGSPQSLSVQFLSEGCGNLQNPFDVSCFPVPTQVNQFIPEVQSGVGDDFRDCTSFPIVFQGQNAVNVHACSDTPAVETGDTVPVPEVPLPILLPLAALGLIAVVGFRKLRRRRFPKGA